MANHTKDTDQNAKEAADKMTSDIPDSFMTSERRQKLEKMMRTMVQKEHPLKAALVAEETVRQNKWQDQVKTQPDSKESCPDKY